MTPDTPQRPTPETDAKQTCSVEHEVEWVAPADFAPTLERQRDENERNMIQWRSLAQEMTPGGSEFMTPQAVRAYYREQKDETHKAKVDRVKANRQRDEAAEALEAIKTRCRVVYFPPYDSDGVQPYPIEHNLLARKDQWDNLLTALARIQAIGTKGEE